MNTTKHTPGPWIIASDDLSIEAPSHPSNGTPLIAQLYASSYFGYDERMSNARLIAAAPRMFDALKDVLGQLDLMPDDQGSISMFNTRQDGKPTKAAMAIRDGLRTMLQTIINDATTI